MIIFGHTFKSSSGDNIFRQIRISILEQNSKILQK